MFSKNISLWACNGVAAYYVKSIVMYMLCVVQAELCILINCMYFSDKGSVSCVRMGGERWRHNCFVCQKELVSMYVR